MGKTPKIHLPEVGQFHGIFGHFYGWRLGLVFVDRCGRKWCHRSGWVCEWLYATSWSGQEFTGDMEKQKREDWAEIGQRRDTRSLYDRFFWDQILVYSSYEFLKLITFGQNFFRGTGRRQGCHCYAPDVDKNPMIFHGRNHVISSIRLNGQNYVVSRLSFCYRETLVKGLCQEDLPISHAGSPNG